MRRTTFGTESDGIQRLVRIHLPGEIRVARDLPAGQIDRIETRTHLLHCLIAGERAERIHETAFP